MSQSLPLIAGRLQIDGVLDPTCDVTLGTLVGLDPEIKLM